MNNVGTIMEKQKTNFMEKWSNWGFVEQLEIHRTTENS